MSSERPHVDARALIEGLRSDEGVVKAASQAAHDQGGNIRLLPEAEIMRLVSAMIDSVSAAVSGDPDEIARATANADDLALDRLEQGISLPDLVHGSLVARAVVVERVIDLGAEMFGADALLPLLAPLDVIVGTIQERMILTYRTAELDTLRSQRTARIEALRELLAGGSLDWAAEAGLDPGGRYHCVVADVSIPRDARRLQQEWVSTRGVSGFVHGYLALVAAEPPQQEPTADLVVVSPRVPVAQLAETFALCRHAVAAYRSRRATGRQPLLAAAQDVATMAQPLLGQLLARELLTNLHPDNDFHRDLALTARTYIASGRRADDTAATLHIHANTLRYRLKRFNELISSTSPLLVPERSLASDLHVWWALHTWLLPRAVRTDPGDTG